MKRLAALLIIGVAACVSGQKAEPKVASAQAQARESPHDNELQKGLELERRGDLDGALQAYRSAYERDPEGEGTALSLSRILARRGDVSSAASIVVAGLKRRPDDVDLLTFKAVMARLQADLGGALLSSKAALSRSPGHPAASVELARALIAQKKTVLAMAMLERSAEANARDARIHIGMSEVAHAMGDDSRALAELQLAASLDPQDATTQALIGALALAHRDYLRAKTAYQRAIALGDDSRASASGLEVAVAQSGDKAKGKVQ